MKLLYMFHCCHILSSVLQLLNAQIVDGQGIGGEMTYWCFSRKSTPMVFLYSLLYWPLQNCLIMLVLPTHPFPTTTTFTSPANPIIIIESKRIYNRMFITCAVTKNKSPAKRWPMDPKNTEGKLPKSITHSSMSLRWFSLSKSSSCIVNILINRSSAVQGSLAIQHAQAC